jgi:hypothetical protein
MNAGRGVYAGAFGTDGSGVDHGQVQIPQEGHPTPYFRTSQLERAASLTWLNTFRTECARLR